VTFKFDKRGQLFTRTHNKAVTVPAMRLGNEESSSLAILPWQSASKADP